MKGHDGRSLRIAITSDALVNAEAGTPGAQILGGLHAQGWGIVALPPATLPDEPARAWLENIADLVGEFARHGLVEVVLFSHTETAERRAVVLEAIARTGPVPDVLEDVETIAEQVLDDLAWRTEGFSAEPPSWTAAARTGVTPPA